MESGINMWNSKLHAVCDEHAPGSVRSWMGWNWRNSSNHQQWLCIRATHFAHNWLPLTMGIRNIVGIKNNLVCMTKLKRHRNCWNRLSWGKIQFSLELSTCTSVRKSWESSNCSCDANFPKIFGNPKIKKLGRKFRKFTKDVYQNVFEFLGTVYSL